MGAAVVQGRAVTGSGAGTAANAEGGVTFNLADSITDTTTPIQVPTATGTNFSWIKNLCLSVTSTGTTNMSNRRIANSTTASTGLALFWKDLAVASYAQAASGNRPGATGSNGSTPAGYTLNSTSSAQWDNTSVSTGSTGINGDLVVTVLGVDNTYVGGGGTAITLPSLLLSYDEAAFPSDPFINEFDACLW